MKALFTGFLFAVLSLFTKDQVVAQNVPQFDRVFTKLEHPPSFGKDSLALQEYLSAALKKKMEGYSGELHLTVLVDTSGKAYLTDYSNTQDQPLFVSSKQLTKLVNTMPAWNVGLQNGHKVVTRTYMHIQTYAGAFIAWSSMNSTF